MEKEREEKIASSVLHDVVEYSQRAGDIAELLQYMNERLKFVTSEQKTMPSSQTGWKLDNLQKLLEERLKQVSTPEILTVYLGAEQSQKDSEKSSLEIIRELHEKNVPLFLWGPSGSGKTSFKKWLSTEPLATNPFRQGINQEFTSGTEEEIQAAIRELFKGKVEYPILLIDGLDEALDTNTIVLQDKDIVTGFKKLTPQYLENTVTPYLNAIVELQQLIEEIQKKQHREVRIISIQQKSPVSVSLDGATDAIQLVRETIIPWRRKHAETMAHLLEQEKQAEIENKKSEILEKRSEAAKNRAEADKLGAEASLQREQTKKMKLENEKLSLELHHAKIQLGLEVLHKLSPHLSETERVSYLMKLLPHLEMIVFSSLEITTDSSQKAG